jgi:hypothetical protein
VSTGGVGDGKKPATPVRAAEVPKPSANAGTSPQSKTSARKDSRARSGVGSSGGMGSGSGTGVGSGSGTGVGPGRGYSVGGGSPGLGGASGSPPSPPSPEELKRRELLSKVNPAIAALIERLKDKTTKPAAGEARFVRDGKAEIQIWLADKSPEVLAQLKEMGFEVVLDPKASKAIIGRLPIENLSRLAELKSVRYVAPITNN